MGLRIALWPRLPPGGQGCQCFASLRAGGDGWLADCGGMGSLRHTGAPRFMGMHRRRCRMPAQPNGIPVTRWSEQF